MTPAQGPLFADIKAILDYLVKGKESDLQLIHGLTFRWGTRRELLDAQVQRDGRILWLIDPAMIGNGRAEETYLVRVLTCGLDLDGDGINEYPRMPHRGNIDGAYASVAQLATIVSWIDAGCPE